MSFDAGPEEVVPLVPVPPDFLTVPDQSNGSDALLKVCVPSEQSPRAPQSGPFPQRLSADEKGKGIRVSSPPPVLISSTGNTDGADRACPSERHLSLVARVSDALRASPTASASSDLDMGSGDGSEEGDSVSGDSGKDELDDAMTLDQVPLSFRRRALVRKNSQAKGTPQKKGRVELSSDAT